MERCLAGCLSLRVLACWHLAEPLSSLGTQFFFFWFLCLVLGSTKRKLTYLQKYSLQKFNSHPYHGEDIYIISGYISLNYFSLSHYIKICEENGSESNSLSQKYCLCELECKNGYLVSFRAAIIFSSLGSSWNHRTKEEASISRSELRRGWSIASYGWELLSDSRTL